MITIISIIYIFTHPPEERGGGGHYEALFVIEICAGETSPSIYLKKNKIEYISGTKVWSFIQFVFIEVQVEDYQSILKLRS